MRMTRKTALAGAAMSVASLVSATFAIASTMDLPVFGFGDGPGAIVTTETASGESGGLMTTTTGGPVVVEQVVFQDVYERVARPAAAPRVAALAEPAPTTVAPAPTKPTLAPTTTVAPTTVNTTTTAVTTTRPATTTRVTTTRPAPPPGCQEPEWDREHQTWHCKGD